MANAFNYATKYGTELGALIRQASLTSELETPEVNWMGAKSFSVPNIAVSGYKTHSRNGGFNRGDVSNSEKIYTLSFDRDIEFFVDRADVDETNQLASVGNVTRTFMSTRGVPEMDAYRFSKLATGAIANAKSSTTALTNANVYDQIKAAILPIRKYGAGNVVVYVSSVVMDLLERSTAHTRSISVTASGPQGLESRVTSIDGVRLIEVWDTDRFKTAYDFTSGYVPAAGAKDINFLVVAKGSVIAKPKLSAVYFFAPGQHTQGDGWLYQNRVYHDLFIQDHLKDGVFVNHAL